MKIPTIIKKRIRILVADEHPLVRKGLKEIFDGEKDMVVVGEHSVSRDMLSNIEETNPDVLITNLSIPATDSFSIISDIKRQRPRLNVLILTLHSEGRFALLAFQSGVSGYLTKETPPEDIVKAVRKLNAGEGVITLSVAETLAAQTDISGGKLRLASIPGREFEIFSNQVPEDKEEQCRRDPIRG